MDEELFESFPPVLLCLNCKIAIFLFFSSLEARPPTLQGDCLTLWLHHSQEDLDLV